MYVNLKKPIIAHESAIWDSFLFYYIITKTRLYNFDRLKVYFYTVKLGFTGVYIIFRILFKNIDCGYSLEPPGQGGSNEYPQSMFVQEYDNYQNFFSENFPFLL